MSGSKRTAAEHAVAVLGDDGGARLLVYFRPSERYSWEPRAVLMREPATAALVADYEGYFLATLPEPRSTPPTARVMLGGSGSISAGGSGGHAASLARRRRFERGTYVLVRDSLTADAVVSPAIVREVQGDTLTIHLVGWSSEYDDTLYKSSGRLGDFVDSERMGVHFGKSGRWRTLISRNVDSFAPDKLVAAGGKAVRTPPPPLAMPPALARGAHVPSPLRAGPTDAAFASTLGALDSPSAARAAEPTAMTPQPHRPRVGPKGGASASTPAVEMASVDFAMGDTRYAPVELRTPSGGPVAKGAGVASVLVERAFRTRAADRAAFSVGVRVLSQYEPYLWYRCTVISYSRTTGKGTILYDADGAYEEVSLPDPLVILLGTPDRGGGRASAPQCSKALVKPACAPLRAGETVVEALLGAESRPWVVVRPLDGGLALLRSRCGSMTVRHTSELSVPKSLLAFPAFRHYVTHVRASPAVREPSAARAQPRTGRNPCIRAALRSRPHTCPPPAARRAHRARTRRWRGWRAASTSTRAPSSRRISHGCRR